jgi:hypothetical protein
MQDTQQPFDVGNSSYQTIQNRPLPLRRTTSEITIFPNHHTLLPPKSYQPMLRWPSSQNQQISSCKEGKSQTNWNLTLSSTVTARLWQQRFAHLHPAVTLSLIDGLNNLDKATKICDLCLQAKHKQKFIRTMVKRATTPFEHVHSDTCGAFSVPTKGGHLHYIIFVDDYMRWTTVYLLPDKMKESCIAAYQLYQAMVDIRGYNIKRCR